ncbi:hypothetical protein B0H13DRAFT_2299719 [Mycena leptocephala]|nr:hypothetical protein B0H13DRAFT_2299719 [Mycena leptocephala]
MKFSTAGLKLPGITVSAIGRPLMQRRSCECASEELSPTHLFFADPSFRRRETLLTAPSAVQLEHSIRATQYRRNYLERTKKPVKPPAKVPSKKSQPTTVTRVTPAANQQNQKQSAVTPSRASKPVAKPAPKPKPPRQGILPTPSVHPRPRVPGSPSPRSLGDIADGDDDAESEMDSDDDGWDADSERDGLGPLLNHTGHPDYVPQPGQQPYFKAGRRYWF